MFCTYHSILDWHHPDYLPRRSWEKNRSAEGADPERYLAYMKAQLKEIITRYGPIGILWFDGEWEPFWTHERGLDLDRYVRSLQPSIIINNRIDKGRDGMKGMTRGDGYAGDYGTPEQEVPAAGFGDGIYWESCMTMQRAWGYTRDREVRPSRELIRHLSDIACKGGNFLLNVGPQPDGQFPAECIERLRAVGAWMKTNAEAIRGTSAGPVRRMDQRATVRGNRLYVHIHDWPSSKRVEMPGLMNRVLGARALAAPGLALKIQGGPGAWAVELPETAPDPDVTVVAVDLDGPPRVDNAIRPGIDGSVHLRPAEATIQGSKLRVESRSSNLGYWTDDADFASWDFALEKGGVFTVQVEAACPAESAGGRYAVNIVDQSVGGEIPDTGGWGCYRVLEPGRVTIPQGGSYSLALRGRKAPGAVAVMNVKGVRLVPAP
jgi:alpha-L-fucosidase